MSYFQKHLRTNLPQQDIENQHSRATNHSSKTRKPTPRLQNESRDETRVSRPKELTEINQFDVVRSRSHNMQKKGRDSVIMEERALPGLMLEGESSMEELLNSSINQFTKYLSDSDPFEE